MPFGIEFVGEDVINAYLRMNIHGSSVCEIVINHFKNACSGRKFTIQILAKLKAMALQTEQSILKCLSTHCSVRAIGSKHLKLYTHLF